eukprot:Gregarina_sp_Poly_1__4852@NODE_2583_length_1948_cov_19_501329_g1640_i0_p1_GENE_NODE_2583_length_1948_cov_19_501329_g1640_i0NODE_2583_length_1948_cov_19_501329_g1640_i0_p1_ORF_typecomplete_len412_score86_07EFhand_11/PF08976_11/1_1e05EFhand_7/PF13499_6/0_03_NODE_2583_length_1948_cov_19_501329_g1640_i01841419
MSAATEVPSPDETKAMPEGSPVMPPTQTEAVPADLDPAPSIADSAASGAEDELAAPSPMVAEVQSHHPRSSRTKDRGPDYIMPVVTPQERMALAHEKHIEQPYEKMKTEELKWMLERERGPQTEAGWWCYVCLCGPQPGPKPDPNEEWPGRKKKVRRKGGGGKKKRRPKKPKKEIVELEVPPVVLQFRQEAVKALQESPNGFNPQTATALGRHMGFVPSEADIARLAQQEPLESAKFDAWILSIAHTEDQDQEALMNVFKHVDYASSGTISEFAFASILANFGEAVDTATAIRIAEQVGAKQGAKVKYKEFVAGLLAANRKLPPPEALASLGIDPSKLPPTGVTEVTHFAAPPWSDLVTEDATSSESFSEDEGLLCDADGPYTPIYTKAMPPCIRRANDAATAAFWSKFHE